jgi:hypothetical protein
MKANSPVKIPAPTDEDKPFTVGEELTVYEAAMVYAGRHPYPKMFGPYDGSSRREHCLTLLKLGLKEGLRRRQRAQRSWDVFRRLQEKIKRGQIQPRKSAYDLDGEIDPFRTVIKTSELVSLANERGENPRYLKHLPNHPSDGAPHSEHDRDTIAYVANLLKQNSDITRDDALAECRNRFPRVGKSFFRSDIWPQARQKAGLSPHARPGRKPKKGQVPILDNREKPVASQRQDHNSSQSTKRITLAKVNLLD